MKKILTLTLVFLLIFSLAACKPGPKPEDSVTDPPSNSADETKPSGETETKAPAPAAEAAKLDGRIRLIELDDRDASVLRGVQIRGLSVGTLDGFNGRESSLTDVRCIFEVSEWVEFYPDTDKEYALRVWVLRHRDDQEYYNTCKFSDLMPGFANYCDLHYPADAEQPDEWCWGSFYLNEEECAPGYYDFVFTYEGKAVATLLTRFYGAGELSARSDAELEALMRE